MKFVLFVEGFTERMAVPAFLKRWLDPRLDRPVGIKTVRFNGWAQFRNDVVLKARMHLQGPDQDQILAVLGLLDLYGPTFYPEHLQTAKERLEWAVRQIEKDVSQERFRMFFAVHEVEAWILSQPAVLPREVQAALPGKAAKPETVNFDEPPAKLLDRLYREKARRSYKKLVDGTQLFRRLDPSLAYQKCPNLKAMLDRMLELAKQAQA